MNFFEAMTALQNGRQVRMTSWDKSKFIGLKEQTFKLFGKPESVYEAIWNDGSNFGGNQSFNSLLAAKWEEFKESAEKTDKTA